MAGEKQFESVLLVEDDASHALLIRRALGDFVGAITEARTWAAAQSAISQAIPQLIVTDLHLPDAAGADLISRLTAASPQTPIVVLTSSTSLHEAVDAMKVGASDFLVKEFGADFKTVLGLSLSRLAAALRMEREQRRLEKETAVLRVAIESSNDGLAVADQRGVIQYANSSFRSFERLCGGQAGNLTTIFSDAVTRAATLAESVKRNLTGLAPGSVWHTEVTFQNVKERAFDLSLSVIEPGNAAHSGSCVVWLRDISEQKRREKFQREILSTTTHDLKGPLGAIMISAELLGGMLKEPGKLSELVLRIGSAAQGAINLIDEFLSARRIQEGTFILRPTRRDIVPVAQEVVENFNTIAAARGITLKLHAPAAPLEISIDRTGFIRVLSNLLSNALKFTPRDGKVDVELLNDGGDLRMRVSDTGSGMEAADVNKIFERFSRLDRHSDVAGSGIGLFVVKSVVNAHGGEIEVTSKLAQGTTFQITFPAAPPTNERGELISLDFA